MGSRFQSQFKSYKARRIILSAMGEDFIAFSGMSDVFVTLATEHRSITGNDVPLYHMTDSKSLFYVISKGTWTSEKRLMLDVATAREGFRDKVISDVGLVQSKDNFADILSKSRRSDIRGKIIERTEHQTHSDFVQVQTFLHRRRVEGRYPIRGDVYTSF